MDAAQPAVPAASLLGWAIAFGLMVDRVTDGPPGLGSLLTCNVAALGVVLLARPRPQAIAFLVAGVASVSLTVVRASPVLAVLDLLCGIGLFALAGAFARECIISRTGVRVYIARALAWTASIPAAGASFSDRSRGSPVGAGHSSSPARC